jgi:hypothetical protein
MTTVPAAWCPGRPAPERIARLLLDRRHPAWRYDLTDPLHVRAALSRSYAGNALQDVLDQRERVLAEETGRCAVVLDWFTETTGLALMQLRAG